MSRSYGAPVLGALVAIAMPCAAYAAISQQFFLSDTNKLYYVVVSDPTAGSFGSQVTSILMTSGTALPVNETSNDPPDPVVTSFGTGLTGGILRFPPLSNIKRTELLTGFTSNTIENLGNPANGVFDPHANGGDGLLTLPGGTRTVAFGSGGTELTGPITASTGAGVTFVPAATNITVTRVIGGTHFTNEPTIVFPNPAGPVVTSNGASCVGGTGTDCDPANGVAVNPDCPGGMCSDFGGEAAGQNVTIDDTLDSRVGNPASQGAAVDGFFIPNMTAIIVFLVDDGAPAFGLTADGFAVTGTCSETDVPCVMDLECPPMETCTGGLAARDVVNTTGDVDNSQFRPTPTNTPTSTPTRTDTPTATATATSTATATATNTATATATRTAADTATATATSTNTPTATPTRTATPTQTPTNTATRTATPTVTRTVTATPTRTPTNTAQPSNTPTVTAGAVGICRTKGFWGTHACPETADGASVCEKSRSQNITQQVIDAAGGSLLVCGKTLTDTHLNHQHSAEEALCVKVEGNQVLQLASQLTAAALNCVISGLPKTCAGSPIVKQFTFCSMACALGKTTTVIDGQSIDCVKAIDCANNGGMFSGGRCTGAGTCSDNGAPCTEDDLTACANPDSATCVPTAGTCHSQPLCSTSNSDLCFEPPGPAGSPKQCQDARSNNCTIFSGAPPCAQ